MNENLINDLKEVFSNVFNINIEEINENTALYSLPQWDSVKHMDLISSLEEEFLIEFEQSEIESMINFGIVHATIEAYLY